MWVMCKYYAILYRGLEHPWILVWCERSWNQSPSDTKGQLYRTEFQIIRNAWGTSLVVQWLKLRASNAAGRGSIPAQGIRSHMPHLKIPRAATKETESRN